MKRGIVAALAASMVVSLGAVGSAGASDGPTASKAATSCNISGKQRSLGASYVTSLKVVGTSCRKGKKITKLYHQCRKAKGGKGSKAGCTVNGWACKTKVLQEVPGVQFNGKMVCKKGTKRIISKYTQNY
jgi:hypothetical protein